MNKQSVWETKSYYQTAKKASLEHEHPALTEIKRLAKTSSSILEVGCGEGTKLVSVVSKGQKGVGVDISKTAINLAKKQYPHLTFVCSNAESLPFKDNSFNLVFSAFVLEHTVRPEKVISEMIRVLKPNGILALVAPNYGAPHRASPCFKGSRFQKLLTGFSKDVIRIVDNKKGKSLRWNRVSPLKDREYTIDTDTTIEPYLLALRNFLENKVLEVVICSSCWEISEPEENIGNKIFRFLGKQGLYPFSYWGPHAFIVVKKL